LGDDLIVFTWVADMQRASSLRRYEITRTLDQAVLARAETRWVFVDLASRKPIRIPPEVQVDFELIPNR
jgi:acyl-CoA thioester hydrolase